MCPRGFNESRLGTGKEGLPNAKWTKEYNVMTLEKCAEHCRGYDRCGALSWKEKEKTMKCVIYFNLMKGTDMSFPDELHCYRRRQTSSY